MKGPFRPPAQAPRALALVACLGLDTHAWASPALAAQPLHLAAAPAKPSAAQATRPSAAQATRPSAAQATRPSAAPAFAWPGRYAFEPQGSDDMIQLLEREAAAMPAFIGPAVLAAMRSKVKNPQSLYLNLVERTLHFQADDRPLAVLNLGGQPTRFTREGREVVGRAWLAPDSLRLRFEVAGSVQAFELVPRGTGLRQTARLEFPRYPRPIRYAHNFKRVGAP